MKKTSLYVVALIGLVAVLGITTMFVGNKPPVHATTNCPMGDQQCLSGWAWSSNIGWISFNSGDSGAGGGSAYDVGVNTGTNNNLVLNGYAWSPNIGWISFNNSFKKPDLNGCNPGAQQVSIDKTTGVVTGWARVVSEIPRSDGWDGCIEMSGEYHPTVGGTDSHGNKYTTTSTGTSTSGLAYGVDSANLNTYGKITGYSWGGNVMGWLNFSPALTTGPGITVCVTGTPKCPDGGGKSINPTCTVNPSSLTSVGGGTLTYTVSVTNGVAPYTYKFNGNPISANTAQVTIAPNSSLNSVTNQIFSATDSANNSGSIECPAVQITGSTNSNTNILKAHTIYESDNSKGSTDISVKKGDNAYLTWDTGLSSGHLCHGVVTPIPTSVNLNVALGSLWNNHDLQLNSGSAPLQISSSTDPLDKGDYTFQILCSVPVALNPSWLGNLFNIANAGEILNSNTVTIHVNTSSLREN